MYSELNALWLYQRLPLAAQNLACWIDAVHKQRQRFGADFDEVLERLIESDTWSAADIEAFQSEQIATIVKHAYETVPHYSDVMRERRLVPADIRSREDLPKLPILTKDEVRRAPKRFISNSFRASDLTLSHTSGTTGHRLDFYRGQRGLVSQFAIWIRHRTRFGVTRDDWKGYFMATPIVPPDQVRPPYWRWQRPLRQLVVSVQQITPTKVPDIVSYLETQDLDYFCGRASVLHALSTMALEQGISLKRRIKGTFVGGEGLLTHQRRQIGEFTGQRVSDQYGFNEGCGNAAECPAFRLHEDFEFGAIEIVDDDRNGEPRRGEIICTGFTSPEFPFIRYQVGDIATLEYSEQGCTCGRNSRVIGQISGRNSDYIVTPEGRRIMQLEVCFADIRNTREIQVVQEEASRIVVRICPGPSFDSRDESEIRRAVSRWISPRLDVDIETVSEIERDAGGKFRPVRSLLSAGKATTVPSDSRARN